MNRSIINTQCFYKLAKEKLANHVFSFIEGGSMDEFALKRNQKSFQKILLSPRVLKGIREVSLKTSILDNESSSPILIAPAAYQGLLSPEGELDMLKAANQLNSILILSMFSSFDYALVSKNKKVPVWLQMYLLKDRSINENFIKMAEDLAFDAIVLTVDTPVYAKREKESKNPLVLPEHFTWDHLKNIGIPVENCFSSPKHLANLLDPAISWKDLEWLSAKTRLPIILKGIMAPEDTAIALQYPCVKGIIISNHGGRQLDSSPAPLDVLKNHRSIARDSIPLFLDGGIQRGSDIFKSIALGAHATLIGRTALWALAAGGSEAVTQALTILQQELIETMILCGCSSIGEITDQFILQEHS